MFSIRTDLAVESQEFTKSKNRQDIPGTKVNEFMDEDIKVTIVNIIDEKGEEIIGKPKGTYITLEIPEFVHYDNDSMNRVSEVLAKNLTPIIKIDKSMTALVVGLGNWKVTPDAVGPKAISNIMVTRHLKQLVPDSIDEGIRPVCAVAPGVLGITGIETGEIIKGIVEKTKPNIVICVDALASRKLERVNRTIQISDTGISPGSGIGNKRMGINEDTIGVPVVAIGVPTVVDAATMANDTIDLVLDELINESSNGSEFYNILKSVDKNEKHRLIQEVLNPYVGDLMVTPKEVDMVIDSVSKIISNGINMALQPALNLEDISEFLN